MQDEDQLRAASAIARDKHPADALWSTLIRLEALVVQKHGQFARTAFGQGRELKRLMVATGRRQCAGKFRKILRL
jgi:hypothetical protein